jgi:hypothetical protein
MKRSTAEFRVRHHFISKAMRAQGLDLQLILGSYHYSGNELGQTCLMTEHGLERLSTYPVSELGIVPG